MLHRLRSIRHLLALLLITAFIACSGCALNDGYAPISGRNSTTAGYGGFGGGG